ncbi:MAG TPA: hypothetical protein VFR47_25265 [Anaerolineales bacterium]|nr:hypothetical protein [Anaerolineales bacterium]
MTQAVRNIPASILARLKNRAEVLGRPYAEILQYYGMEQIWEFLDPPLQAFLNQTKSTHKWIPQKGWR